MFEKESGEERLVLSLLCFFKKVAKKLKKKEGFFRGI